MYSNKSRSKAQVANPVSCGFLTSRPVVKIAWVLFLYVNELQIETLLGKERRGFSRVHIV